MEHLGKNTVVLFASMLPQNVMRDASGVVKLNRESTVALYAGISHPNVYDSGNCLLVSGVLVVFSEIYNIQIGSKALAT